uniref:Uncharacterized protein n=1 Tax=Cacopsylla melanoneura TaxID=428564 RepID=A0A8D9AY40_9HEMI
MLPPVVTHHSDVPEATAVHSSFLGNTGWIRAKLLFRMMILTETMHSPIVPVTMFVLSGSLKTTWPNGVWIATEMASQTATILPLSISTAKMSVRNLSAVPISEGDMSLAIQALVLFEFLSTSNEGDHHGYLYFVEKIENLAHKLTVVAHWF